MPRRAASAPWGRVGSIAPLLCLVVPCVWSCSPGASEGRTVEGRVVSGWSGKPLVRAIVYREGSLDRVVTDEGGEFSIRLPEGATGLLVQALAYDERLVSAPEGAGSLEVTLEPTWSDEFLRANELQTDDPRYLPRVDSPAYPLGEGPVVGVDEGHHNAHSVTSRYRAFAEILQADGYKVERFQHPAIRRHLDRLDVFVTANPQHGLEVGVLPTRSAFAAEEVAALRAWVDGGGSLFLIADHMPTAGSAERLLEAFGVSIENGFVYTFDDGKPVRGRPIVFRRATGSLGSHPVTVGRSVAERVDSVLTFTGFAFQASEPFQPLLTLPENAVSVNPRVWWVFEDDTPEVPVPGWLQGAAAQVGSGRVVIMGEAAMFTAQVRGEGRRPNGLTHPAAHQNAQLLLNVMHWLSGIL